MAEIVEMKAQPADPGYEERTQPAALKELDDAALAQLMKDLRAAKANADDQQRRKALTQALRRSSEEKLVRLTANTGKKPKPAKARAEGKGGKPSKADRLEEKQRKLELAAEKLETKRRKLAEKAEKIRVREAEKAEGKETSAAKVKKGKAADRS